jgi:hypothetical protein
MMGQKYATPPADDSERIQSEISADTQVRNAKLTDAKIDKHQRQNA